METKANYIIIGAFTVLVAIAALAFGLFTAKYTHDTAWRHYQIRFNESVIGLSSGSAVLYNGVNVGQVSKLQLNPKDLREVLVTVQIDAKVPIHEDTKASIRLKGLTGSALIQLSGGSPDSPLLRSTPGALAQIESVSSPLNKLLESSEGIVVTANKVLNQLNTLFSDKNIERISTTLESLERFGKLLEDPDSSLNQLLANGSEASKSMSVVLGKIATTTESFDKLISDVDQGLISDLPELKARLSGSLSNLESLSGRLDSIIASNQDELSQFGGIGMQQVTGGVEDIRRLIRDLSGLVRQIENNPARFLLGGEQPEEYRSP